jgi:ribosomal-protein-alanine N-acetyltransferase
MTEPEFISGEKVYLRALAREDLSGPMLGWSNDEEVTRYMYRGWRPSRIDELETEFDKTINSNKDIEFAICDKAKGTHIGVAGIHDIDWLARNGEYRIMIGDKNYWGKGCGTETAQMVIRYAFEKLNLHRLGLGVNAEDKRAIKSYEKAGFVHEGISREVVFRNNKYYDAVRMGIIRRDYESA